MTATHAAALASARDSFNILRETLSGLPDEAMDFKPAEGTNALAVLVTHAITATRFMFQCGTGQAGSLSGYRSGERAASFQAGNMTTAQVVAAIDAFLPEAERLLAAGDQSHVDTRYDFPEDPKFGRTGAGFLVHGCAHLREHVGQAELMRDLWNAR